MIFTAGTVSAPASRAIRFTQPLALTALSAVLVSRATAGTPTEVIDRDAVLSRRVGTQVTDYQMRLESFGGTGAAVSWSSSDPAVATVDTEGYVTHVSDGSATITATAGNITLSGALTFSSTPGATTDELTGYVSGSTSRAAVDGVDTRLAGKSAATALRIFSTQDHTGGIYVRNPACWASDVDLTPISPWNSVGGTQRAGTLISPRHVLFAAHYGAFVGMVIRFVAANNTVVTRTITAVRTHPSYTPYFPDVQVGVLDSDVPVGIGFARVLPADWATKIPALGFTRALPALCLDQEEKALVTDWGLGEDYASFIAPAGLNSAQRIVFYEEKVGGDSGNPAFLIIRNQLVLVTAWTYGGAGRGTFTTPQIAAINTMMSQLGGGYQLTAVDLSADASYP